MSAKTDDASKRMMTQVSEELLGFLKDIGVSEVKNCTDHGDYDATVIRTMSSVRIFTSCPDCVTIKKQADIDDKKAIQLAERNAKMKRLIGSSGIPKFFAKKTFDEFIAAGVEQEAVKLKFVDFAANVGNEDFGGILIAHGVTGAGKTHLSIAAAISVVARGNTVLYVLASDVIRSIRDTWANDSKKTESQVLRELATVDLLLIDEVGVQFGTESEQNHIFEVINNRMLGVKPTILVTNLLLSDKGTSVKTLRTYLGERTYDRFKEVGASVSFDWQSHRGVG